MKKILFAANLESFFNKFLIPQLKYFKEQGYEVHIAAKLENLNVPYCDKKHDINFARSLNLKQNIESYKQMKKLFKSEHFDIVSCHTPFGGAITRLAFKNCKVKNTKMVYMAHGFHFYKGAPKKNWLIFYPIERICSSFTDVLITINKEDYAFAKKHMKANQVEYVPGVGIDTIKFSIPNFNVAEKKAELGLKDKDIMILSVGELNQNKNHEVVVRAISKLKNPNIHYFIAGKGDKEQYLDELAKELDVNLHLLGYRTDIIELLNTADIFAFPSFREGLSVALMEAMAAGLPCVVSKIRGNVDLIEDGINGYLCRDNSVGEYAEKIEAIIKNNKLKEELYRNSKRKIAMFDICKIEKKIEKIYLER